MIDPVAGKRVERLWYLTRRDARDASLARLRLSSSSFFLS